MDAGGGELVLFDGSLLEFLPNRRFQMLRYQTHERHTAAAERRSVGAVSL
jgi:hypothetical protein